MTPTAWNLILGIHILGAAIWVGGMAFMVLALRPSLATLDPATRLPFVRGVWKRFFLVVWHAMPITLATGYAILFGLYGGFAGVGWNVHVMHLLGLIMAAIFLFIVFVPFRAMRDPAAAGAAATRIRPLVLINLLLGSITILIAALNG